MFNCTKKMGSQAPQNNPMHRGGYHTTSILFGSRLSPDFNDEEFSNFDTVSLQVSCQNSVPKMERTEDLGPPMQELKPKNVVPLFVCNRSQRKRRKQRYRKKKRKNQKISTKCMEKPRERARTLSTDSDDSFIIFGEKEETSEISEDFATSDSEISRKRVRWAPDNKLCEVHPMIVWSYAHRTARTNLELRDSLRLRDYEIMKKRGQNI